MKLVGNADPSAAMCPYCGRPLRMWRIDDLTNIEYQAHCRGCDWMSSLRLLVCGGCHWDSLFFRTGERWRCLWCGHEKGEE